MTGLSISDNTPELWRSAICWPEAAHNKYDRGHAIILGGGLNMCGAAKLAAYAALRIGAGLVSVACDEASLPIYAASFQAVMTKLISDEDDFRSLISDGRVKSILLGPGAGINDNTRNYTIAALSANKPLVLDADALTVFSDTPDKLFSHIKSPCIMTPHNGEFMRLFGGIIDNGHDQVSATIKAAKLSNAIIIRKGFNTVIAAPDGRVVINGNSTPFLATAGSGDVLAGFCVGLLAQSMPAFEAACAAVWIHSEAARRFGAGLIAEDISLQVPAILQLLYKDFLARAVSKNP